MRKITKPIMWFVAILFVAFLGWQGVFTSSSSSNAVANINGEDISFQVYQAFHDRNYRLAQQEFGDTVEFADYVNQQISNKTWEDLVSQIILSQEAKKRGILITDVEVFEYLRRFPPFELLQTEALMTDGRFDYNKYAQALMNPQVDWTGVENYVREKLLIAKLQMMVTGLVRVSRDEVRENWLKENTELSVRFVKFPVERYLSQIQPTQAELDDFYQKNKGRYFKDERAELYYVEFSKLPQPADDLKTKEQLGQIKAKIQNGEDFSKLAKEHSEDQATKQNGGDLGWIETGSFIPALDQDLRTMQPGEIRGPIKSSYGWHLLKLQEKRKNGGRDQYRVSHILLTPKMSKESLEEVRNKAGKFAGEVKSAGIEKAAAKQGLTLGQTGWFTKGGYIQRFGENEQLQEFAFSAKVGDRLGPIETPSGFYVVELYQHRPNGPADFNEVREQVMAECKAQKAVNLSFEEAKPVYQDVVKSLSLDQTAKAHRQVVLETGKFKANESVIPNVGRVSGFTEAALALSQQKKISPPVRTASGTYILELTKRETLSDSTYNAVADSLFQNLLEQKQNQVYSQWYSKLRGSAKIKDHRDQFLKEESPASQG